MATITDVLRKFTGDPGTLPISFRLLGLDFKRRKSRFAFSGLPSPCKLLRYRWLSDPFIEGNVMV